MRPQTLTSANREQPPRLTVVQGGAGAAGSPSGKASGARPAGSDRDARFRDIYETWFDDVVRWMYALGAPAGDTEDIAQEIFLIVRRQLSRFRGGNLAGWLYEIAL